MACVVRVWGRMVCVGTSEEVRAWCCALVLGSRGVTGGSFKDLSCWGSLRELGSGWFKKGGVEEQAKPTGINCGSGPFLRIVLISSLPKIDGLQKDLDCWIEGSSDSFDYVRVVVIPTVFECLGRFFIASV